MSSINEENNEIKRAMKGNYQDHRKDEAIDIEINPEYFFGYVERFQNPFDVKMM